MLKKIIILPISLYIHNQQQRTEAAFRKLGVGKLELIWQYVPLPKFLEKFRGESLPTIFDQYRRGELITKEFRQKIREKFPNAAALADKKAFDAAWNEMQVVTDITREAFKEAQTLVDQGYVVYPLSGTNPLHVKDIKHKSGFDTLPGVSHFSHEKGKLGKDLFSSLLSEIRAKYKEVNASDIAFFYTPPKDPYPRAGRLAWLNPFAIVKNIEYLQARKYVESLKREAASKNGFMLIACQPNEDKKANIIDNIEKLGWNKAPAREEKASPTVTNLRDAKRKLPKEAAPSRHVHSYNTRSKAKKS